LINQQNKITKSLFYLSSIMHWTIHDIIRQYTTLALRDWRKCRGRPCGRPR